jgi:hypothetical protein
MSDLSDIDPNYCPVCGIPVDSAQAIAVSDGPIDAGFEGTYEREAAHVVVEGAEIRLYRHADGGGS